MLKLFSSFIHTRIASGKAFLCGKEMQCFKSGEDLSCLIKLTK